MGNKKGKLRLGVKRLTLGRLSDMSERIEGISGYLTQQGHYIAANTEAIRQVMHTVSQLEGRERSANSLDRTVHAKLDEQHRATRGLIEHLTTEVTGLLNSMAKERQGTKAMIEESARSAARILGETDLGMLTSAMREVKAMGDDLTRMHMLLGPNFTDWRKQVGAYTSATWQAIMPAEDAADQRPLRRIVLELEQQLAKALRGSERLEGAYARLSDRTAHEHGVIADAIHQSRDRVEALAAEGARINEGHVKALADLTGDQREFAQFVDGKLKQVLDRLDVLAGAGAVEARYEGMHGFDAVLARLYDLDRRFDALIGHASANGRMYAELRTDVLKIKDWQEGHNARFEVLESQLTRTESQNEDRHGSAIDIAAGHYRKLRGELETLASNQSVNGTTVVDALEVIKALAAGTATQVGQLEAEYQNRASATAEGLQRELSTHNRKTLSLLESIAADLNVLVGAGHAVIAEATEEDWRPYGTRAELGDRIEEVYNLLDMRTSLGPVNEPADRIEVIRQRLGTILRQHVDSSS